MTSQQQTTTTTRTMEEFVYIMTTEQYESQCKYIIGHTRNLTNHLQRLNFGRPRPCLYYYVKYWGVKNGQVAKLKILEHLSGQNDLYAFNNGEEAILTVENAIQNEITLPMSSRGDGGGGAVTTAAKTTTAARELNYAYEKIKLQHVQLCELQKQIQFNNTILSSIAADLYDSLHREPRSTTTTTTIQQRRLYSLQKRDDNVLFLRIDNDSNDGGGDVHRVILNENRKRRRWVGDDTTLVGSCILETTKFWDTVRAQNYNKLTYGVKYRNDCKTKFEILNCAQLNSTFNIMQQIPNSFPFNSFDDFVQKCFIANELEIFHMMQRCHLAADGKNNNNINNDDDDGHR